jgi:DNA-binding response OmpR family regulator
VLFQSDVMIVDDNPINLKLLEDMLLQRGHEVRSFPLGRLALAAASKAPPDLILLDINMPEMNGYEVCERLKSNPQLAAIPVIFLSALNEVEDKVKGFRSGAVDYVSKPFQFEEVHARVETHLKLHQLQTLLELQNGRLEETVAGRTRELAEANARLTILDRSKDEFLRLISHEFRTPLNGLLGAGELILHEMPATPATDELREIFKRSRRRILSILDDALLLTQIDVSGERFRFAQVSLHNPLNRAIEKTAEFAAGRGVVLPAPTAELELVLGDEDLLVRAFNALLETAVKFSTKGEKVELFSEILPDSLRVIIESHGMKIPDPLLPRFFEVFSIGDAITAGGDLGVAPALANRILLLFGASVSVENREPAGIRLTISLRRAIASKLAA